MEGSSPGVKRWRWATRLEWQSEATVSHPDSYVWPAQFSGLTETWDAHVDGQLSSATGASFAWLFLWLWKDKHILGPSSPIVPGSSGAAVTEHLTFFVNDDFQQRLHWILIRAQSGWIIFFYLKMFLYRALCMLNTSRLFAISLIPSRTS